MPRHRLPYPAEFRRQMVDLVRSGRTPEELSREFEPSAQAIWIGCVRPIVKAAGATTRACLRPSARS